MKRGNKNPHCPDNTSLNFFFTMSGACYIMLNGIDSVNEKDLTSAINQLGFQTHVFRNGSKSEIEDLLSYRKQLVEDPSAFWFMIITRCRDRSRMDFIECMKALCEVQCLLHRPKVVLLQTIDVTPKDATPEDERFDAVEKTTDEERTRYEINPNTLSRDGNLAVWLWGNVRHCQNSFVDSLVEAVNDIPERASFTFTDIVYRAHKIYKRNTPSFLYVPPMLWSCMGIPFPLEKKLENLTHGTHV